MTLRWRTHCELDTKSELCSNMRVLFSLILKQISVKPSNSSRPFFWWTSLHPPKMHECPPKSGTDFKKTKASSSNHWFPRGFLLVFGEKYLHGFPFGAPMMPLLIHEGHGISWYKLVGYGILSSGWFQPTQLTKKCAFLKWDHFPKNSGWTLKNVWNHTTYSYDGLPECFKLLACNKVQLGTTWRNHYLWQDYCPQDRASRGCYHYSCWSKEPKQRMSTAMAKLKRNQKYIQLSFLFKQFQIINLFWQYQ